MKSSAVFRRLAVASLALFPSVVFAHPGHEGGHDLTWDFAGGALHPLTGLDHLLAMVAVGVWAFQLGGRARWALPATFVGVMALGAMLGQGGAPVAGVEQAIAASLLALGLLVASAKKLSLGTGLALTATFAVFHGFAHGAELPANASGLAYGLGFVAVTALLHGLGLFLGQAAIRQRAWVRQSVGASVAAVGVVLLLA